MNEALDVCEKDSKKEVLDRTTWQDDLPQPEGKIHFNPVIVPVPHHVRFCGDSHSDGCSP